MTFCSEYSAGVFLLGPNTEVIGSLIISLFGSGGLDLISALSVINVLLISVGLLLALRLGVRLHACTNRLRYPQLDRRAGHPEGSFACPLRPRGRIPRG